MEHENCHMKPSLNTEQHCKLSMAAEWGSGYIACRLSLHRRLNADMARQSRPSKSNIDTRPIVCHMPARSAQHPLIIVHTFCQHRTILSVEVTMLHE